MRIHWMTILAAPSLVACASSSEPARVPLMVTQESAVLVNDVNDPAWPTDPITLDSAVVTDNGRVRLFTRYGGGCANHAAALLVGRTFEQSSPPVLRARIAHNAKNDACDALIAWTLEFELKPVRDHYQQEYGSGTGSVVLDIGGQRVTYAFP